GLTPGRCYAVIMIGRIDDYLTAVARDAGSDASPDDLRLAGLAIVKRAYACYRERSYEAELMVAALRGTHHMEQLAGADLIMSIHPVWQKQLLKPGVPRRIRHEEPVAEDVIRRLQTIREFVRAYEPDGLKPEEFLSYGITQRTLAQFCFAGWAPIAGM
ncbi:MAG: transaldolase family protein, partial [Kiritimatiellae bacterium]|nr:transaldolase family protein [Kiritimatiellia bacterium]